jgi:CDP-diacylglycerol---glycerol-3-phosphate 3-phosphatidyltransferase
MVALASGRTQMLDGRWRASVERGLEPVGKSLKRAGINADVLTVIGLAFAVGTAFLIASGHLVLAVFGVIATGVPDILDGTVARHSGRAGPRGAFLDSVSDRVSDAVLFGGVAWFLVGEGDYLPLLAFAAVALSMLISYERAKAESLGFTANGGIMERAERMVLLAVGLAFGILVPVMWIMVVLLAVTAVHRFAKVWRQATPERPEPTWTARMVRIGRRRHRRGAPEDVELTGASRRFGDRWRWPQSQTRSSRRRTRP